MDIKKEQKIKNRIISIFKDYNKVFIDGEISYTHLIDLARKLDEEIINKLLQDSETKNHFFKNISGNYNFLFDKFERFINSELLDNSYTSFKNRIGLTVENKFIKDSKDIVLNFPYKDCYLEGGQTKDDGEEEYYYKDKEEIKSQKRKRKEIFFNEYIAYDEIDSLLSKKALCNFKRFTKNGIEEVKKFSRDNSGVIKDNLIIKGNNLLALHSLYGEFKGKVKLIYIDPPYNTGNDTFSYNDNFNHSSWLVFMKNRLEIAKELLRDDGVIFIQCDDNEQAYLKVLMDEIFERKNFITTLHVELSTTQGMKIASAKKGNIVKNGEFILVYAKNIISHSFINLLYASKQWDEHYNIYIDPKTKKRDTLLNFLKPTYKDISKDKIIDMYENSNDFRDFIHKNSDNIYQEHNAEINFNFTKEQKIKLDNGEIIEYGDYLIFKNSNNKIRQFLRLSEAIGYTDDFDEKFRLRKIRGDWWSGYYKDMGNVNKQGDIIFKKGKKPERLIKDILKITTNEGDLILDFFAGSGTTLAVAHKMKRQYIGVEQIEKHFDICVERLKKVIEGERGGISKTVNWEGGGEFISFELAKYNEIIKEKIINAKDYEEIKNYFAEILDKFFLRYNLNIKEFEEKIIESEEFKKLDLKKQKDIFISLLDPNQIYINYSNMEDKIYKLNKKDIYLTREFYKNG